MKQHRPVFTRTRKLSESIPAHCKMPPIVTPAQAEEIERKYLSSVPRISWQEAVDSVLGNLDGPK